MKIWQAPAKINLFLHIVGQRADGYHLLQTVFQFLDYHDELCFNPRQDGQIYCHYTLPGLDYHQDLVYRAACLLKEHTGTSLGADIHLLKKIPQGAGLGGGSSNAATTLVALNAHWGTGLAQPVLKALGCQLGADVPIFIDGRASWAEGIGEQLQPLDLPEPWYLVIVPNVNVSTAEIFRHPQLTRNQTPLRIRDFLAGMGTNICEPVVFAQYPVVAQAALWLRRYASPRMSGTGSSVFAAFSDEAAARKVLDEKPDNYYGFVAKGLNQSPLLKRGVELR